MSDWNLTEIIPHDIALLYRLSEVITFCRPQCSSFSHQVLWFVGAEKYISKLISTTKQETTSTFEQSLWSGPSLAVLAVISSSQSNLAQSQNMTQQPEGVRGKWLYPELTVLNLLLHLLPLTAKVMTCCYHQSIESSAVLAKPISLLISAYQSL